MAEPPDDQLKRYYAEKLWELIPPVYRFEDGVADNPNVLRSLVEVLGEQAAIVRRSSDRLWEDQFIDFCDDWAVPYLGDLVGTRMVSAFDRRGRRIDVAKTIYYRRRAGTLVVLEELIADIAGSEPGWEGSVVEEFRRLLRHPHGLDAAPAAVGRLTATPAHGLADLRSPRGAEAQSGAWDEYHYLPDMRRNQGGLDGCYAVTTLAFHLFRLGAFQVIDVVPRPLAPDSDGHVRFSFDPSGRTLPLFQGRTRPSFETNWRPALQWELPQPIRCEVLSHAEYMITEALILSWSSPPLPLFTGAQADVLRTIRGIRFARESQIRRRLDILFPLPTPLSDPQRHRILADSLVADCGKAALLPGANHVAAQTDPSIEVSVPVAGNLTPVAREMTVAGDLLLGVQTPPDKTLVIDGENGLGYFTAGPPPKGATVTYHYGFSGNVGAGAYSRGNAAEAPPANQIAGGGAIAAPAGSPTDALIEIEDSSTYTSVPDISVKQSLVIRVADFERPYVELASDWTITATRPDSTLVLDGLWLGGRGKRVVHLAATAGNGWSSVSISHCTLDPGGVDADATALGPVSLSIECRIDSLTVASSIMGPIAATGQGLPETTALLDSIVHATAPNATAIALDRGMVNIERCTVIGPIDVHQIEASELLATGVITVANVQSGCIRFSAFPDASVVPYPYRSQSLNASNGLFTSDVFGNPGYAQLSNVAPDGIVSGGENGTEIGVWNGLLNPIKLASLRAKIDEFLPFGLIALFVTET